MFAGIRKRLARKPHDIKEYAEDDDKDDLHTFAPPANYIKISQGKIQLVHQSRSMENEDVNGRNDKEVLENRIVELEQALLRVQEKVNKSQFGTVSFEKELREQLDSMSRAMKSKERKQLQTCREHKTLQTRFARQESLLHALQQENKTLLLRVRQYEHCLDDVMRKVVDAIVAEDNLREEVAMLKSRVRDLEAQNAALSGSPAKGRDEGYCTMSSGQPQPSSGHLENLPEEPEQWLLPAAEPCSTEMEDWSMSQEELAVMTIDEEREQQALMQQQQQQQHQQQHPLQRLQHAKMTGASSENDWVWNSSDFLSSTMAETDSVSDGISQLLQQKIVYSEDEDVACTEFTNDFYKLVNIHSSSARSLYSYEEGETDDEDDDDDDDDSSIFEGKACLRNMHLPSPTPSEAGQAQVTSCSSSETDELSNCNSEQTRLQQADCGQKQQKQQCLSLDDVVESCKLSDTEIVEFQLETEQPKQQQQEKQQKPQAETHIPKLAMDTKKLPQRPQLIKSKSLLDEQDTKHLLRNRDRRNGNGVGGPAAAHRSGEGVVRSGSVNCAIAENVEKSLIERKSLSKLQERLKQKTPTNSWRKSNGWRRVTTSPIQTAKVTPTTPVADIKAAKCVSSARPPPPPYTAKVTPTKIPTCISSFNANHSSSSSASSTAAQAATATSAASIAKQTPQVRKSKIPPPVPVRRSYAAT